MMPVDLPPALESLQGAQAPAAVVAGPAVNVIREDALRETALGLGARGGLAWRAKQLRAIVEAQATRLDQIFNFQAMMLPDHVVPPVLTQGSGYFSQDSAAVLRLADQIYRIESPARFSPAPPNWRDYLVMHYADPEWPDRVLLPRDDAERAAWSRWVQEGWAQGVKQANAIYETNLARLKRDYAGMARYRTLHAQGMVSAPFVATSELGVTGGGDAMAVGDRVLRITATPALQADSKHWEAVAR